MKKIKATSLVVTLVAFLSLMSVAAPNFNYFFLNPAKVGQCSTKPPAEIGKNGVLPAEVGFCKPGLAAHFNNLVKQGIFGIAPF